jgi:hypothetical protein
MFHCSACHKEFAWSGDYKGDHITGLQVIDPEVDKVCDCGGEIVPGFYNSVHRVHKGEYYHVSESLGINPLDATEHRKMWPKVDVLPDGRLGFHSVKEQQRYANHFGMDKQIQRRRR